MTKVTQIKHAARNYAGVDASAADLMRPMMYGAYHHISVSGKEGAKDRTPWDVVGRRLRKHRQIRPEATSAGA